MQAEAILRGYGLLFAVMAALAVIETLLPLAREREWRRRHLAPNLALAALTLALNLALNAGAVLVSAWLAARGVGLLAGSALSPLALTGIALVALDGATYACHRSLHWLAPLWRVHRVHHADPLVDVTTTLRQHPLESLWRFAFILAPASALGLPPQSVVTYRVVSALVGLAEHMNVRLWQPLDAALTRLVCTPNMHKLHHSRLAAETDSNFGNLFALYDRVFGTFMRVVPGHRVESGLHGFDAPETQRLGALLRLPFRAPDPAREPALGGGLPLRNPVPMPRTSASSMGAARDPARAATR